MKYFFTVGEFDGALAEFLLSQGVSSRILTSLRKKPGLMLVNGKVAFSDCRVKTGDEVTIDIIDKTADHEPYFEQQVNFLFEDEHLCVIDKPYGLASIETRLYYSKSLPNVLASKWGREFSYHPLNRLDKDTSGLMIVAKNAFAHSRLDALLQKGGVKKSYLALVQGILPEKGVFDFPIGEKRGELKRFVSADGKTAVTSFVRVKKFKAASLAEVSLLSGRTHQIRLHFSHAGFPLLGDSLYGGDTSLISRQALHSAKLSFVHPFTQKLMTFESKLPDDIDFAIKRLEV